MWKHHIAPRRHIAPLSLVGRSCRPYIPFQLLHLLLPADNPVSIPLKFISPRLLYLPAKSKGHLLTLAHGQVQPMVDVFDLFAISEMFFFLWLPRYSDSQNSDFPLVLALPSQSQTFIKSVSLCICWLSVLSDPIPDSLRMRTTVNTGTPLWFQLPSLLSAKLQPSCSLHVSTYGSHSRHNIPQIQHTVFFPSNMAVVLQPLPRWLQSTPVISDSPLFLTTTAKS